MKRISLIYWWCLCLWCVMGLASCQPQAVKQELKHEVDSLNRLSYTYHYKDLTLASQYANKAYELSKQYGEGRARALNNMGFVAFMSMDFEQSIRLYQRVEQTTSSEIERLIADIGMMKNYQRTSQNKEFYDAYNSAQSRINRIYREFSSLSDADVIQRFNYAITEYYICASIYYYYLESEGKSRSLIKSIPDDMLRSNTAQQLYYLYLVGSGGFYTGEQMYQQEFAALVECLQLARSEGYPYFEANALQALAELLMDEKSYASIVEKHSDLLRLLNKDDLPINQLIYELASTSNAIFNTYGDWYQISGSYRTLASYYSKQGDYQTALNFLALSLNYVNRHHTRYYKQKDSLDILHNYVPDSNQSKELKWIKEDHIKTIPLWITRIREQLSQAYAAMGEKAKSDYNRNIYLDLLDYIRQDKELETRHLLLQKEEKQLNTILLYFAYGTIALSLLFFLLDIYWTRSHERRIQALKRIQQLCLHTIGSVPVDIGTEEALLAHFAEETERLKTAFPLTNSYLQIGDSPIPAPTSAQHRYSYPLAISETLNTTATWHIDTDKKLSKHLQKDVRLYVPYLSWAVQKGLILLSMAEEHQTLVNTQYVHQQHIIESKYSNEHKRTCLSIVANIQPYIDRILHETERLLNKEYAQAESVRQTKLTYIEELISQINEYNQILSLWIKLQQGAVSVNIENFSINELFTLIIKGKRTFESKEQQLIVHPSTAVIKADKVLTLFMLNTLLENAHKFTPQGGNIEVAAEETDAYVEVSVKDTGIGLSQQDIQSIVGEKVYDPQHIGKDNSLLTDNVGRQKGNGFGLMNCRGIIEQYKKINRFFHVCQFGIDSQIGKGSRFYFRLPKGVRKQLYLGWILLSVAFGSCQKKMSASSAVQSIDPIVHTASANDTILGIANNFAEQVYENNIKGEYQQALAQADSAIFYLNLHYQKETGNETPLLQLKGEGTPTDLLWWYQRFDTDYYILLRVRNEVAVTALAIKDFTLYAYNNKAYTDLYKQLTLDTSLEITCQQLEKTAGNKRVAIFLFATFVISMLTLYYLIRVRNRVLRRYNIEQVFTTHQILLEQPISKDVAENAQMYASMMEKLHRELNEIVTLSQIALLLPQKETPAPLYYTSGDEVDQERLQIGWRYWLTETEDNWTDNYGYFYSLIQEEERIGLLFIKPHQGIVIGEEERQAIQSVISCLTTLLYHTQVELEQTQMSMELAKDDTDRLLFELNTLHIQNMVLDNGLSTIKHETVYYPNRIKQIVDKMHQPTMQHDTETVETLHETTVYYKEIFSLLYTRTAKQIEQIVFRRAEVSSRELLSYAEKYFQKQLRKMKPDIRLTIQAEKFMLIGDKYLLRLLFESLINEALRVPVAGNLHLSARADGEYVRFTFIDERRNFTQEELNLLFYPERLYTSTTADSGTTLHGAEYLLCKQIIRDHDEYAGRRGCRINASVAPKGFAIWFTIPYKA